MANSPIAIAGRKKQAMPIAYGQPTDHQPVSVETLAGMLKPFIGASTASCYFGPSGIGEDGVPWIAIVTQDVKRPRLYREMGRIGLLAWRWNVAPACPVSLTVMGGGESRPHARWMKSSEDPIAELLRDYGRFYVCLIHPGGQRSGWFDAIFKNGPEERTPSTTALAAQWSFRKPGIPFSKMGKRYNPFDEEAEDENDQIPMWSDSIGDVWRTLGGKGPWTDDLQEQDLKIVIWAKYFHHKRSRAAGFIQMIIERQEIDGVKSLVNADGLWIDEHPAKEKINDVLQRHPTLRTWVIALAGPLPDAKTAHEGAFATLNTPEAIFAFAAEFMAAISSAADPEFCQALQFSCEAALLDTRITDLGRRRPWLRNVGFSRLELCTITLDSSCVCGDLETLWRSSMQFVDLLDAGEWFGPTDMPAPLDQINAAMEGVRVEGSLAAAAEQVIELLREAQEARQWSIPWGARIQVQFGPFVALRIFEKNGEFSCHFLDERDRYLHVAIGLGQGAPRISSIDLMRQPADGGEPLWNDDGEVSLQLIAAAVVRDFLVVEEREAVFSSRSLRKRIAGRNINTIIYLPRARYSQPRIDHQVTPKDESSRRQRHAVSQHLRRVNGTSAAQRFLAQKYGVSLPEGFTFVRPHIRGAEAHENRLKIYRSRSASHMIFERVASAPIGTRPAWFEFEKDCARILEHEGMKVIHQAAQRDGDGGMDLFAVDLEGNSWVVQCKCWAPHRPIGPDVIRELVGAISRADRGATRTSRSMIITTTSLTSGAVSEAIASDFRIIDGVRFVKMMQDLSP